MNKVESDYKEWLKSTDGKTYQGTLPKITAYCPNHKNARRRSFRIGEFTVMVEPHEDDKAQEEFTRKLAEVAAGLETKK
jgi:hypothetical protein